MAKVAFLGLGVMGAPMARHLAAKGHEVTVYNRTAAKAEAWVPPMADARPRRPPRPRRARISSSPASAMTTICAQVTLGRTAPSTRWAKGAVFVDHTTASASIARELAADAPSARLRLSRCAGVGRTGRRRERPTDGDGRRRCGTFARAEPVIMSFARACRLLGPSGSGQLAKMMNQICIAGVVQGLAEAIHFGKAAGPRCRGGDRRHLQGRGAVLADGEPLQDHARRASTSSASPSTGCARTSASCSTRPQAMARACR